MRLLLVRGLRKAGYRKLCKGQPLDSALSSEVVSKSFMIVVLIGLTLFGITELGWSFWGTVGVLFLGLLAIVVFTLVAKTEILMPVGYFVYVLLWLTAGVLQLLGPGLDGLLLTHALPFALVLGVPWAWRALRLAAAIPLFLPVALIIALSPLLTEDPWRVADEARWGLLWLATVAIGPLLLFLIARHLRISVPNTLLAAARRLDTKVAASQAIEALKKLQSDGDEKHLDEKKALGKIRPAYNPDFAEPHAEQISRSG